MPIQKTTLLGQSDNNAFCHRDWRDPESVRVAIYADRVEIRNPGSLPEGLTVERMRQGHISRRRNPLVADLLRRVHLVEAWGRGMPLILEKAPHVEFEDVAGIFIARVARPPDAVQDTAANRRGKYWPPLAMTNRRPFLRCRP